MRSVTRQEWARAHPDHPTRWTATHQGGADDLARAAGVVVGCAPSRHRRLDASRCHGNEKRPAEASLGNGKAATGAALVIGI